MTLEQKIPDSVIVIPRTHPLSWIMMFPTLHIGRRKLVMKNDLIQWLKSHTNTTPKH